MMTEPNHWIRRLAGGALALFIFTAPAAADQSDFRWRGPVEAGRHIEIKGVNGRIEAVPATGDHVDVRAVKFARRSDPREVRIEVVEHGDGVTICAVYPTPRGRRPNECVPGSGGRNSTRNNDVRVEFTVQVPEGVGFVGRTVNGDVEVGELSSPVSAKTVNGSIEIDGARSVNAETVNGSILASFTRTDWTRPLELRTVNGEIAVALPGSANVDVELRTVNGDLDSAFPLMIRGRVDRRRVRGVIGDGGRALRVETVNGDIRLRRRG